MIKRRFSHTESRTIFWVRHLLHRLVGRRSQPKISRLRLCAFPNDLIGREIAVAGTYEAAGLAAMQWLCDVGVIEQPGASAFIDIGANVGVHTIPLAPYFATTIAFEPHPLINLVLALNVHINDLPSVVVHQYGLSDADGTAELCEGALGNLGASSLERRSGALRRYAVRLRRGDVAVREATGKPVALVKIDVEGHEPKVIVGLSDLLREEQPVVAFEANDDLHNQRIMDLLAGLGYVRFLALDWSPSVPYVWLRVIVLTLAGAKTVLRPVDNLKYAKYSLVFALSLRASQRWEETSVH